MPQTARSADPSLASFQLLNELSTTEQHGARLQSQTRTSTLTDDQPLQTYDYAV